MPDKYLHTLHWFLRLSLLFILLLVVWTLLVYLLPRAMPEGKFANTDKWGIIWRNERWSGEIHIVGDTFALPGTTVIINPGTRVLVNPSGDKFNLHWLPWGLKSGLNTEADWFNVRNGELFWDELQKIQLRLSRVYAIGTPEQPVVIQSTRGREGSPYDFNIFSINSGVISYAQMGNYRRFLVGSDVTIRDSNFSHIVECAICIEFASPTVISNTFEGSLRQHIFILAGSPKVAYNLFKNSACVDFCSDYATPGSGIVINPLGEGSPVIEYNDFEMGGKVAVDLLSGSEDEPGLIQSNKFLGGTIIEIPCNTRMRIVDNQVKGWIRFKHSGNCLGKFYLEPNYFWTEDPGVVLRENILDKEPQFELLIPTVLSSPPPSGRSKSR